MEHIISEFNITDLFNCQDVKLRIDNSELVLIGENGTGKTTVMNMFYHMLNGDFLKMDKYEFSNVELKFLNGDEINFNKYDLELLSKSRDRSSTSSGRLSYTNIRSRLMRFFKDSTEFTKVLEEIERSEITIEDIDNGQILKRLNHSDHKHKNALNRDFEALIADPGKIFDSFTEILKENLDDTDILYFPTYRRVEEDLKSLDVNIDEKSKFGREISRHSDVPIQFGMNDVSKRFEDIKTEVSRLSSKALTNLSGEILRQLVRGNINPDHDLSNISKSDVEVVLSRLGTMFSDDDNKRILEIVESGQYPESDKLLIYFLGKLVEIYGEQKEIDLYTDKYVEVCNKYLEKTELIYDKSNVDIYVQSNRTKSKISLNSLSSGEQQIVSLFSKIYLNSDRKLIILFDEPELSLSIFWQMTLLPDIVSSDKCKLLIAVTHSPFIYDNSLKSNTKNLSDFLIENQQSETNAG